MQKIKERKWQQMSDWEDSGKKWKKKMKIKIKKWEFFWENIFLKATKMHNSCFNFHSILNIVHIFFSRNISSRHDFDICS